MVSKAFNPPTLALKAGHSQNGLMSCLSLCVYSSSIIIFNVKAGTINIRV